MTEAQRQEFWGSLALKHGAGLGPRTAKRILDHFGSAGSAVAGCHDWQAANLVTGQQLQGFLGESWRKAAEDELAKAEELRLEVLTWASPGYPDRLRQIIDPPLTLYYQGDISLLANPSLAIVGSRECSRYGIELAHRISMDLADQGVTIVSGLAYGIDREAHLGGLKGPGSSIAVMGTGLDLVYPSSNMDIWRELSQKGLIITEYAPGTKPHGGNFPQRNRIISGLALGVLVVEARSRSGSLITARLAMDQGKEVFAVPGPVSLKSYRGCHEIINQGAKLVHGAEDILLELKPQLEAFLKLHTRPSTPPKPNPLPVQAGLLENARPKRLKSMSPARPPTPKAPPELTPVEAAAPGLEEELSQHLAAMGATHVDALCRSFSREAGEMSAALLLLELKGVVRRLPGGYYLTA